MSDRQKFGLRTDKNKVSEALTALKDAADAGDLVDVPEGLLEAIQEGKVEFAPTEKTYQYPDLYERFVRKVFHSNPDAMFISDFSDVMEYGDSPDELVARAQEEFDVDITPVLDCFVWEVLEYIHRIKCQ